MSRLALRPDQVGGDHRLAVAGRERVQRAPAEGREQQDEQHALAGRRLLEERGEAVAPGAAGGHLAGALGAWRRQRAATGCHRERCLAAVERAVQQILRVAAQAVGGIPARRLGAHRGVLTGRGHDRLPAHAVLEGFVLEPDPPRRVHSRAEVDLEPRGLEAARTRREAEARLAHPAQLGRPPVDAEREPALHLVELALEQLGARNAALLDGRDLRLVEHVADVHALRRDGHLRHVIDREVAERVRLRGRRGERQHAKGQQRRQQHPCLHRSPSSRSAADAGGSAARPRRARSK